MRNWTYKLKNYRVILYTYWLLTWGHCPLFAHRHSTHTRLTALSLGLSRWAGTRKVKPIWILLKQETVSGNGISCAICKSAPRSRQITTPAPHHSVVYRPDALPAAQPTAWKHWSTQALKATCDLFPSEAVKFKFALNCIHWQLPEPPLYIYYGKPFDGAI